jgi:hypothetical protein
MVVGEHARIILPPWLWLPGWHPFGFWMQGKGKVEILILQGFCKIFILLADLQ